MPYIIAGGGRQTGYCCYSYSINWSTDHFLLFQSCWGGPVLLVPAGIPTLTWWTYGVVMSGHWLASTLIHISTQFCVLASYNHVDQCSMFCLMSRCSLVCWFRVLIFLKYKMCSGVFDLMTPPSCHAVNLEAFYNTAFSNIVNLMKPVKRLHFSTNLKAKKC